MVLDQLFKTIVEGAQALVEGDGAAIELPEGNDLFCVAATGSIATLQSRRTSQQTSVSGEVFRSGASLCLEREQENAEQVSEDHSGSGGQSLLLVAMATQSRTVGVLQVARSKQHSSFTNAELHQLQVIGTLAAQVIAHAEAFSEKEKLLHELQEATEKLKVLRGLLPICSHCKKIRDQTGLWNHLEVYITAHSEANFTHSICPHCAQSFYKVPMRGVPSS
jgi:transcriptional regulator with GAF, ATPase, and Fis domain